MFEQATLTYGSPGKRAWTAFLGLTSQVALVGAAMLTPMIWPEIMPRVPLMAAWIPLVPEKQPDKQPPPRDPAVTAAVPRTQFHLSHLIEPSTYLDKAAIIEDPPVTPDVVALPRGLDTGARDGWLTARSAIPARRRRQLPCR